MHKSGRLETQKHTTHYSNYLHLLLFESSLVSGIQLYMQIMTVFKKY
jgi:hypothetical protein